MAKEIPQGDIPEHLRPVVASAAKNLAHHLYGPDGPPWGTSFDEMEQMAVLLARRLGAELLSQALQRQADGAPPEGLRSCPACSGPLQDKPPEPRAVQTQTGEALWQEPAAYCTRCRRAFSPSGQKPRP